MSVVIAVQNFASSMLQMSSGLGSNSRPLHQNSYVKME